MKLRSGRTTMATPSRFSDGDGDNMKAYLWGKLQSFIDLSMIYAKLPLAPFFRLRQVCKEWNRLASDRQFLEQNFRPPISSNPYFILTPPGGRHVFLTCEGSLWSSTPVPRVRYEVSGLLFEDSDCNRVFDLHTRMFHTLPPLPALEGVRFDFLKPYPHDPMTLMTVDTTLIPYGFRVLIVDATFEPKIYDSNSGAWTFKSSAHKYSSPPFGTLCIHYNKCLHIRAGDEFTDREFDVQFYNLERDEWDYLKLAGAHNARQFSEIGLWQDRFFVLAMDTRKFPNDVTLEEIPINSEEEDSSVFDCMPRDLREWMCVSRDHKILNKFCGEHLLLYNRHGVKEERAVLYNFDQKTWNKVELPTTRMSH